MDAPHISDGTDERGEGLEIVIRISADGRVYLHDITADLLPVLLAMDPENKELARRAAAAAAFEMKEIA